jgi:membrane associated rhomboid family serine protease
MDKTFRDTMNKLVFPICFVLLLWFLFGIKEYWDITFGLKGVYPRKVHGLLGILTAPLIHSNVGHLISNTMPLIGLSAMLFIFYRRISYFGFFMIYILTGFVVWLFARQVFHVGSSGVVYGLVSFVFFNGLFRRSMISIMLALIVTVMYLGSGYFFGILPNQEGISWESHLFGAIVGAFVSFILKDVKEEDDVEEKEWDEEPESYYFPRDIFEKTKAQRRQEAILKQEEMLRQQELLRQQALLRNQQGE